MVQWQCSICRYMFEAETAPDRCPSCRQACTFLDVTCYTPDCGGEGNVDPQLVKKRE